MLHAEIVRLKDEEAKSLLREVPDLVDMQKKLKNVTPHTADHYKLIFQIGNKFKRVSLLEKKVLEDAGINLDDAMECLLTVSYWPDSPTDRDYEKMAERGTANEKFREAALREIKRLKSEHEN